VFPFCLEIPKQFLTHDVGEASRLCICKDKICEPFDATGQELRVVCTVEVRSIVP